jgi:DNA-binding LacI/PurR family transcriptional regulator
MKIDLQVLWKAKNSPPMYRQFKELIRGAIQAGVYLPGEKLESEREFMEKGGVSYPTIARALRELADEKWIVRKIGSGSYVLSAEERILHSYKRIGVFYYNTNTPLFKRLYKGLSEECKYYNIELSCIATGMTIDEGEKAFIREIEGGNYDAVIGFPFGSIELNMRLVRLVDQGISVIMIGSYFMPLNCDSICCNYESGASQAAHYLLKHGCGKLVLVNFEPRFPFSNIQISLRDSMKQAISEYGRKISFEEVHYQADDDYRKTLLPALLELCRREKTGVVCDSDLIGRLVADYMLEQGIDVPGQASVIGSGNLEGYCMNGALKLSTIDWPMEQIGKTAVKRLIDQKYRAGKQTMQTVFDTSLILRATTPGID